MRGTLHQAEKTAALHRFIPAYAGNTLSGSDSRRNKPVHPRVCGEHNGSLNAEPMWNGSSPRMRGTPRVRSLPDRRHRFIPAYAGNTHVRSRGRAAPSVHPRVCGEHYIRMASICSTSGSSPRMRGTLLVVVRFAEIERFIPAYAGNTRDKAWRYSLSAVHPRVCGEHARKIKRKARRMGSSPRMRGTLHFFYDFGKLTRFIPAYAGNTSIPSFAQRFAAVHPRVCGEHPVSDIAAGEIDGSSPRMRGTRAEPQEHRPAVRFIPAYAGNT